ncbi:MAG TPA: pimeloyl-ACP methyl ester esterase BioH [Pseudomonadales bacterium]|nr:pimeloyl-ACP methyl ester esterase BioH [Pseudomonadales bacterium]
MALQLYHDVFPATRGNQQAQDLVLLHGWGMSSLVWDGIMPELLENFRVTVIDLPGLGRSPLPGGDYTLDYLTNHVLAVAPKEAVWMGWSLGALVAMNIAIHYPERIKALISITSSPSFAAREQWPHGMPMAEMDGFIDLLNEDADGSLIRFLALQAKGSVTQREDIRTLKEMMYFHGLPAPQALRAGMDILRSADLRVALSEIRCPSLHVFGQNDAIVSASTAEGIKHLLPKASTVVLPGVSHIPFISDPEGFLKAIQGFLNGCRA